MAQEAGIINTHQQAKSDFHIKIGCAGKEVTCISWEEMLGFVPHTTTSKELKKAVVMYLKKTIKMLEGK